MLQTTAALVDALILLAIGILFFWTLEERAKRSQSLRALHELRSVAHVIDMHQLTKDPESIAGPQALDTPSSPARDLSRFELTRYLDYCSELLAITSKLAALHAQHLRDPVVLAAVRDIESLTGDLSGKIWQKLTILDVVAPEAALTAATAPAATAPPSASTRTPTHAR